MSENRKIEIITGDGKDLDISPVYSHFEVEKPKEKNTKKNIVIPTEKR